MYFSAVFTYTTTINVSCASRNVVLTYDVKHQAWNTYSRVCNGRHVVIWPGLSTRYISAQTLISLNRSTLPRLGWHSSFITHHLHIHIVCASVRSLTEITSLVELRFDTDEWACNTKGYHAIPVRSCKCHGDEYVVDTLI
jgi:hypothetical protein